MPTAHPPPTPLLQQHEQQQQQGAAPSTAPRRSNDVTANGMSSASRAFASSSSTSSSSSWTPSRIPAVTPESLSSDKSTSSSTRGSKSPSSRGGTSHHNHHGPPHVNGSIPHNHPPGAPTSSAAVATAAADRGGTVPSPERYGPPPPPPQSHAYHPPPHYAPPPPSHASHGHRYRPPPPPGGGPTTSNNAGPHPPHAHTHAPPHGLLPRRHSSAGPPPPRGDASSRRGPSSSSGAATGYPSSYPPPPPPHYHHPYPPHTSSSYPPPPPHSSHHPHAPMAPPPPPPPPTASSAHDTTSLGSLTVRFVQLLHSVHPPYGTGELDLNRAMDDLGVQKRRLYDVTNVLEGIGLIEKRNKNQVAWVVPPPPSIRANEDEEATSAATAVGPMAGPAAAGSDPALMREVAKCKAELAQLDRYIDVVHGMVQQYTSYTYTPTGSTPEKAKSTKMAKSKSSHLFVTQEEISQLQNYANDTIVAIRAPSGTVLEVPDPDKGMRLGKRRFQIYLSTPKERGGKIEVDLVQHGRKRGGGSSGSSSTTGKRSMPNKSDSSSATASTTVKREEEQLGHRRSSSQGSLNAQGGPPPPPSMRQLSYNDYPVQERRENRDGRRGYDRQHTHPPQSSRASPPIPPQLQIPTSLPKSDKGRNSESGPRPSFAPRKRPLETLGKDDDILSPPSKKGPSLSWRPTIKRRDHPKSPLDGPALPASSSGSQEKESQDEEKKRAIKRRAMVKPRRRSPTPSSFPRVEKCNSFTPKEKNYDLGSFSTAEPMTPRAHQALDLGSGLPVGTSPGTNRRNFDLLNAPLHSPGAFYLEASPLTACRNNTTPGGVLASPFRFSPNIPFSPFPNTPSAMTNWDSRGRIEKGNSIDFDLFPCSPLKETKMK